MTPSPRNDLASVAPRPPRRAWLLALGALMIACTSVPTRHVNPTRRLLYAIRTSPGEAEVAVPSRAAFLGTTTPDGIDAPGPAEEAAEAGGELRWFLEDVAPVPGGAELTPTPPPAPAGQESLGWDDVYVRLQSPGRRFASIEPDVEVSPPGEWAPGPERAPGAAEEAAPAALVTPPPPVPARIRVGGSWVWPGGPPGWHLAENRTGLGAARRAVRPEFLDGRERVRIAHIDTGHAPFGQVTTPYRLAANQREFANFFDVKQKGVPAIGDAEDRLTGNWESLRRAGFIAMPGHGSSTLGVLAGKAIRLDDGHGHVFEEEVGGAPDADVICIRVGPTVVHLDSTRLAQAIDYATNQVHADVISLSHGGLPSPRLTKAVNDAYKNGTAVFAAASDFYELPPIAHLAWWVPRRSPSRSMWPASYERVMSVAGVTARKQSYALDPPGWLTSLAFWKWGSWMLRGSYGPGSVMAHTISAYSPNIVFARYTKKGEPLDLVDLDGGGTSAATPQVAAAAALWLQHHREDPALQARWRSWEKVENVYRALILGAGGADHAPDPYLGMGILDARRTLDQPPVAELQMRPPATVDIPELVLTVLASIWLQPKDLPEDRRQLLRTSVRYEVAQIAALDPEVGQAVEALAAPAGGAEAAPSVEPVLQALRQSKFASGTLRAAATRMAR